MKQAKKYWAWTARQRGRCHTRCNHGLTSPAPEFLRSHWHRHRARTREALHLVLQGFDESEVVLLYQPRHGGQHDWA